MMTKSPSRLRTGITRIAILVCVAMLSLATTGCVTQALENRCRILERLEPEGHYASEDGTIVILARASYFVPSGRFLPERSARPRPGPVYVILGPRRIAYEIRKAPKPLDSRTTESLAPPIRLDSITVAEIAPGELEGASGDYASWLDYRLIPPRFRSVGATLEDLPPELRPPDGQFLAMNEPLDWNGERPMTLDLTTLDLDSMRRRSTIPDAVLVPIKVVEFPVFLIFMGVLFILGVMVYSPIAMLLSE